MINLKKNEKKHKSKKRFIFVVVVILILIAGLVAYFVTKNVKDDENQNEKDEIIQKINDVLSVLEYERLEEVLKYVKRKKNQKK